MIIVWMCGEHEETFFKFKKKIISFSLVLLSHSFISCYIPAYKPYFYLAYFRKICYFHYKLCFPHVYFYAFFTLFTTLSVESLSSK